MSVEGTERDIGGEAEPMGSTTTGTPGEPERRVGRTPWMEFAIAALVASTSVLGALAAWGSARASNAASRAHEQVLIRQAGSEETTIRADVYTNAEQLDYLRLREALSQAQALRRLAHRASNPAVNAALLVQSRAYSGAAQSVLQHMDRNAVTVHLGFNAARLRRLYYEETAAALPLETSALTDAANRQEHVATRLRTLALAALIAAFFLTLAQVSRTRAWRVYFGGGVAVLAALVVELAISELG